MKGTWVIGVAGTAIRAVLCAGAFALAATAFASPVVAKERKRANAPLDIRPQVAVTKPSKHATISKPEPQPQPAGMSLASAEPPKLVDLRGSSATIASTAAFEGPMPAYMRVKLTASEVASREKLNPLIAKHAQLNGIPEPLVHRVIMRESRYQPRALASGNYGLMQIRHATARLMGYSGPASGLLDAETNLTYAVKYLAGAYRKANGNPDRAVGLYARGY